MFRHRFLWIIGFMLLALPLSLSAQTTTGTVRGYVKDQNGAGVADAEVSARNALTDIGIHLNPEILRVTLPIGSSASCTQA